MILDNRKRRRSRLGRESDRTRADARCRLHATKCVNALEGGFIATNDVDLAEELRLTRNFGFVEEDRVAALGINAKMNEFCAAVGLTSLESFKSLREHNSKIQQTYRDAFNELDGVALVTPRSGEEWNYHYAILELRENDSNWRNALHKILWAENILVRRYFAPGVHRSFPYSLAFDNEPHGLDVSDRPANTLLALPTGTQMEISDAVQIGEIVRFCIANRSKIRERLRACP